MTEYVVDITALPQCTSLEDGMVEMYGLAMLEQQDGVRPGEVCDSVKW